MNNKIEQEKMLARIEKEKMLARIEQEKMLARIESVKSEVDELGELFLSNHTRPIKYTSGHAKLCELLNDVKPFIDRLLAEQESLKERVARYEKH